MSNFRDIFTLKYLKQIYTWKTPELNSWQVSSVICRSLDKILEAFYLFQRGYFCIKQVQIFPKILQKHAEDRTAADLHVRRARRSNCSRNSKFKGEGMLSVLVQQSKTETNNDVKVNVNRIQNTMPVTMTAWVEMFCNLEKHWLVCVVWTSSFSLTIERRNSLWKLFIVCSFHLGV